MADTPPLFSLLTPEAQLQAHCLWDDMAQFEAAHTERAMMHLLDRVSEMIGAQNAYWMGAMRITEAETDPLRGWRPGIIRYWKPLPQNDRYTEKRLRTILKGQLDESVVAQAKLAGTFRAHRLRDIVSPAWFDGPIYQNYLDRGIHDSLTVGIPLNAMTESYYGFLRMRPDDPFTAAQVQLAAYTMRGLVWFHRQVLLAHGIGSANRPLTPTERKVTALLLTDKTESEIADELGVTSATAHTYVRDVLQKFGAKGRAGLTALWLGKQS